MAINHCGRRCAVWVLALFAIALHSCSGGISGTGDGGPIIVVTNTDLIESSSTIGTGDGGIDGTTDGTTDGTAQTDSPASLTLPVQIYYAFPAPLIALPDSATPDTSVYAALREQFTAATDILLDAQVWVDLVSAQLPDTTSACFADTSCISSQLSTGYLYSADTLQNDLTRRLNSIDPLLPEDTQLAFENSIREQLNANLNTVIDIGVDNALSVTGDQHNIRLQSGDATLDLTWRLDNGVTVIRYTTPAITLQARHQTDANRFTLRFYNRQSTSVLAAAFESVDGGRLFEGDLHRAGNTPMQHYFRGFSSQQGGTLIARDPNRDATQSLSRERYLSSGQLTSQQVCDRCEVSENWLEQLDSATPDDAQYVAFEERFGGFEQSIADDISLSNLDATIDEWVVTNNESEQSPNLNAACHGQRVGDALRNICWTLALDPEQARTYREQLQPNGDLSYQLLD